MSWVTVVWSMIASACLTLALVHGLVWWWRRNAWANGLFVLSAVATTLLGAAEVWLMRAQTSEQCAAAVRWGNVAAWALILTLVGFVRLYLRAGRGWLVWSVCGLRTFALIPNFLTGVNINYREVTALRRVPFLGEEVSVAVGSPNPWMLLNQIGMALFLIFVADAALSAWRRGDRRQSLVVGGSIELAAFLAVAQSIAVFWGIIPMPITVSLFYTSVIAAMSFELSRDVFRASQLAHALNESEHRMTRAAEAAGMGIWIRNLDGDVIWASDEWRALFGYTKTERLRLDSYLKRLHPEDREAVLLTRSKAIESGGHYEIQFRVLLPDGRMRWIESRGRVEFDSTGRAIAVRGVSLDVTARKLAEEAAHDLSGRLIHAQEEAQALLARELHDDFSQSLALLAVELDMFGHSPPEQSDIAARMKQFSAQVQHLSSEVHQVSHNLHPAKLEQLGLVAAVRGFCKEFALAHQMAVEFSERDVPRTVPDDTALCLYRVAQEALHNVVKHSGGSMAKVELTRAGEQLCLVVEDDGTGFDSRAARTNGSLGLVSMSERARFVGGRLTIESRPGAGTRVEACVPIAGSKHLSSHNGKTETSALL